MLGQLGGDLESEAVFGSNGSLGNSVKAKSQVGADQIRRDMPFYSQNQAITIEEKQLL